MAIQEQRTLSRQSQFFKFFIWIYFQQLYNYLSKMIFIWPFGLRHEPYVAVTQICLWLMTLRTMYIILIFLLLDKILLKHKYSFRPIWNRIFHIFQLQISTGVSEYRPRRRPAGAGLSIHQLSRPFQSGPGPSRPF